MATSASTFAAELLANLDADRARCTVATDQDESICDEPGAPIQTTCAQGHSYGARLCPRHAKARLYCPGRIGDDFCEARIVSVIGEVSA